MRPRVNNDILLCFEFYILAVISPALEHCPFYPVVKSWINESQPV